MDRPAFFAFYPADFANDVHVEAMSTLQVGAYMLLLCKAWQGDPPGSLPNDDQILARYARLDAAVWAEVKFGVLVPFPIGADGRLHNKRLRLEYDRALLAMKANRERAKKAASTRWNFPNPCSKHAPSIRQAINKQCSTNATEREIESKDKEEPPKPPATGGIVQIPSQLDSPEFQQAWAEWLTDRKARRKPVTELAAKKQLAALEPLGAKNASECIRESIKNGWTGLFPERFQGKALGSGMDRGKAQEQRMLSQITEALGES